MISTRFTSKRNNKTQRLFSLALSLFFLVQTSSIFFLSAPADADLAESTPYSFASIEDWVDKANSSGNDLFAESQIAENCLDDDECEFLFFDFSTEENTVQATSTTATSPTNVFLVPPVFPAALHRLNSRKLNTSIGS